MGRIEGSAALRLDFGGVTTTVTAGRGGRAALRLVSAGAMCGPEKYKTLERQRRQAQIRARHLLHLMEGK